ncbi:MAG: hypothetical protein KJN92_02065, partial [Gemmatimonadetes bacterium]|nr:hypothetical protein [Gemmatimonadota bacterium]
EGEEEITDGEGSVAQPVEEPVAATGGPDLQAPLEASGVQGGPFGPDEWSCSHCGAVPEPGDGFCGDCGGTLISQPGTAGPATTPEEPPSTTGQPTATEGSSSTFPARVGLGAKVFFALVAVSVLYFAYQEFGPAEGTRETPAESESMTAGFLPPTDREIIELTELMDQAARERTDAELAGDREMEAEKAQEWQHCKTAMTHAMRLREAIVEMREAEEVGDPLEAQSKIHTYQHYQGQLYQMLPYVHEPLAPLIRRWADE